MAIHLTNARVHHLVNVKYLYNLRERYNVVKHILWKGFKGESSLSFHLNQLISKVGSTFLTIFLNASGYSLYFILFSSYYKFLVFLLKIKCCRKTLQ